MTNHRTYRRLSHVAWLGFALACSQGPATATTQLQRAALPHSHAAATNPLSAKFTDDLQQLTARMARFHAFGQAAKEGYTVKVQPCFDNQPVGAMGWHFVNGALMDDQLDPLQPEAVMYEPGPQGQMTFVGVEFIVPFAVRPYPGSTPPTLYGQDFSPNVGLQLWALHAWVGRENPLGVFQPWNPNVSCANA
jgi:hypothetical protein